MRVIANSVAAAFMFAVAAQAPTQATVSERVLRDYATVAQHLVPPLVGEELLPEIAIERAAIEAKERWRVVTLRAVESSDRRIDAIAREGAEAHSRLLDLKQANEEPSAAGTDELRAA